MVALNLRKLSLPSPAGCLYDAVVLAARDVGKRSAALDLAESGTEAACQVGINIGVLSGLDRQAERVAHRGERDVSVVQDDRAGLDDLLARIAHAELTAAVEQRLIGADENGPAVEELARQLPAADVSDRWDPVLLALSDDLIDELVGRREIDHGDRSRARPARSSPIAPSRARPASCLRRCVA